MKKEPEIVKPQSERHQEWLNETIEVEFHNIENPGLDLKFSYGSTNDVKSYHLEPGKKYSLPRKVVQHIESRCTPVWKWRPDGSGIMQKTILGNTQRFQCRQVFV